MRVVDRYQENMTPGPIPTSLKKPVNPKFDAFGQVASSAGQGSYKPDTWGTWDLVQVVPKSSLPAYSSATTPGYRYRYEDNNIVYGFSYWYYVAAYKEGTYVGPDGETTNRIETHSTNRNGATGLWALTFPFAFQNANYGKLATTDAAASTKGLKNIGAPVLGSFPSTPLLIASSPPTSRKMEDIVVEIRLVDSSAVAKLFGIGFDLNYSNTSYIDFVSADTSGCFLGRDLLYILNSSAAGKISIGLSQKAPAAGIAGGGKLIQLVFRARATAPDNGACGFSLSSVTATDKSANPITLAAISSLTTITSNVVVWPGDTDTSGVVNQVDVLPLGLHWGRAGSPRPSGTSLWVAQYAIPLVPQSATYADANGDGIVNQGDLLPIGLNWGKTHSLSKTSSRTVSGQSFAEHANTLGTPVLRPIGPTSVKGKVTFEVSISLGDSASSVSSLFGLAFILDFSGSKGMIQALLVTQGDFLGNDVVFFPQIDNGAGTVAIGMTQKLGAKGAAGFGRVAKVTFQIVNAVPFVMLTTRDVVANDPNGNPIWILPSSSSVLVSTESSVRLPSEFQLYQNYPNPFNPSTKVSYGLPKRSQVNLTILDLLGRTVTTLIDGEKAAGSHDVMWDASAVPSGIYFYRLQAGEFVDTKKMILLK
jgi:hypothetical protein